MEIHGTIHFKLILPHFPGFQQEPLPAPRLSLLGRGWNLPADQNEQNQRIGGKHK